MEQKQPLQRHPSMSDEEWQEQLEEMKAHAKRLYRQCGGRLDVFPYSDSPPKAIQ
jgi:hypothetical protein